MAVEKARAAAKKDKREGKSASTQSGEYVHEVIENVRKGKHGARSTKQAIAIGLSEARRDGVKPPVSKTASKSVKKKSLAGFEVGRASAQDVGQAIPSDHQGAEERRP